MCALGPVVAVPPKEEEAMRALGPILAVDVKGPVVTVTSEQEQTMHALGPTPLLVRTFPFLFSQKHRRFFVLPLCIDL
jgi:hypothetical protein